MGGNLSAPIKGNVMNRKKMREMRRMIEYIKTMKELNGLLVDFNPAELTASMAKVTTAMKKYKPIKN
jgi:hypothetical protein